MKKTVTEYTPYQIEEAVNAVLEVEKSLRGSYNRRHFPYLWSKQSRYKSLLGKEILRKVITAQTGILLGEMHYIPGHYRMEIGGGPFMTIEILPGQPSEVLAKYPLNSEFA